MNIENLDKLITHLEGLPDEKFDIAFWYSRNGRMVFNYIECKTAACIAGWAAVLAGEEAAMPPRWAAMDWLGLSMRKSKGLFMPSGLDEPKNFPRARAIDVLKHLRETGEVDWDRFPTERYIQ